MKKELVTAKVVNGVALVTFTALGMAWLLFALAAADGIYPLWVMIPALVGISFVEYHLGCFIDRLGICIENAEERLERIERKRRLAEVRRRNEKQYQQWLNNCERFYHENMAAKVEAQKEGKRA